MGKIILNGIPYTAGKVDDITVNNSSIVDQNGIAELSEVAVSGDYDDLTNKPTIPSDENVTQMGGLEVITDNDYEVLLSGTPDNTTRTEGVRKTDRLIFNPYAGNLQVHKTTLKKIVSQVFNDGVVTAGSTVGNTHYPEVWVFNQSTTSEDGGRIVLKCPSGGHENGIWLSINNGSTYRPIAINGQNMLKEQFTQDTYIELICEENGTVEAYSRTGSAGTTTITEIWRVLNYYNTNSDINVTQRDTTDDKNYRVLFSNTNDDVNRTEGARKSTYLRFNPSTGNLQATQLNGTNISDIIKFHVGTYSGSVNSYSNLSLGSDYTGKTILGATVNNALTYVCVGKNTSGGNMLAFRQIQTDAKLANGTAVSGYVFYSD